MNKTTSTRIAEAKVRIAQRKLAEAKKALKESESSLTKPVIDKLKETYDIVLNQDHASALKGGRHFIERVFSKEEVSRLIPNVDWNSSICYSAEWPAEDGFALLIGYDLSDADVPAEDISAFDEADNAKYAADELGNIKCTLVDELTPEEFPSTIAKNVKWTEEELQERWDNLIVKDEDYVDYNPFEDFDKVNYNLAIFKVARK